MSSQDENQRSLDKGSESCDVLTKPKISYSRKFLLSISSLGICKKLPSVFVESLTSELEDALLGTSDRPKIPGSLPFQGSRRIEYASSPPTRSETGSYSRGIYGKWESRTSGRSDRDSDSQSDRDSDSARRYGNHSRRSWQTPEHDGLLGSGSFPRSSGYATGISASKVQANEPNQLSRSNEPYHPPRPYKAVPHSRRDTDAYNDETFGSTECTSEDRAEQERRRRASFEMMRKEQQKALQEKQNFDLEKHKDGGILNLCEVLVENKDEKGLLGRTSEVEVSAVTPILSNDFEKSSSSHASASRPLIPPGFKSNPPEKNYGFKSLTHPPPIEVGKPVAGESPIDDDTNLIPNANDALESQLSQEISLVDGQPADKTQHTLLFNKGENAKLHVRLDVPIKKHGVEDKFFQISSQLDSHGTLDNPGIADLKGVVLEDKTVHDSSRNHSMSILEKIFGSASSMNDGHSSSAELHDARPADIWSPGSVQSSKFVQWFSEEEAKAVNGGSPSKENDLLSLIVSGDKDKHQVSDSEAANLLAHNFSYTASKQSTQVKLDMPFASDGLSGQACINNNEDGVPTVLTCEDLEHSLLSEYCAKTTDMQPKFKSWSATGGDTTQPSARVDNNASLHLLSMLHKSTDQSNTTGNSVNANLADKQLVSRQHDRATVVNEPKGEENGNVVPNLGKTLTLEALFGTAFMQELQSVEAPVSVQRGPESHGLPFPVSDSDISSPVNGKSGLPRSSHDQNYLQNRKLTEAENWRFDDSQIGITSPKFDAEKLNHHGGFEGGAQFQFPEGNNLVSVGDNQDPRMPTFMSTGNSTNNVMPSSSSPINIMEKLAAFGAVVKDKHSTEGSENMPPFARDSYQIMQPDTPFHNLQLQHQSSPHFQPPQMSQGRPLFRHLESDPAHMSSQLKFSGPEPILNHDYPANHPFSSNIIRPSFHQPNIRVSGFDVPSQHPMLHHMQMQGNHPPPHFARGSPVPHHGNQTTGLVPEMNQMQGFPLGPRQHSIGSSGVPLPGNPPEAFQRLMEMELRAKSKQIHPFSSPTVHGPGGMFGHEVNMAFRYR